MFPIKIIIFQAFLATCFTWFMTGFGAAMVFVFRSVGRKVLDGALGFAGGVMIAASYWSLLAPAIEISKETPAWLPAVIGFLSGGAFLWSIDKILPHLHIGFPIEEAEGIKTSWRRVTLLILAITLHNIPEGLAVGVAFGTAGLGLSPLSEAVALTIGIGIQNFPEGFAVSMPLKREGFSRLKSFWYGQLSGIVEPLASVTGAAAVTILQPILPYALSFAAGAMIFVVIEEVIPESQRSGNTDLATVSAMTGFTIMMILDTAFS
ncbi:ZIP family metal transporter [Candidatus Bathyarchaeota archaeon]|nr:ZIP family metal transporter [Candidatus Bathyarchaeota archaeon]